MTVFSNGLKTKPAISSPYGPRIGGAFSFHYGTDYVNYTFPCAVEGGIVSTAGWLNNEAGNTVAYDLPWKGPKGETITVVHMHMASISVRKGQHVSEGQHLGVMGNTGNASGKCDHVEVRYWLNGNKVTVNSDDWLTARVFGGASAGTGSTSDLFGAAYTKVAQVFLQSVALYADVIDGIAGPNFVAGTKKFQEWTGLTADGIFGPDTVKKMEVIKAGKNLTSRPVVEIQQALMTKGFYPLAADGIWGNQTSLGTYAFQAANGLSPDAQYGPMSDAVLFRVTPPPEPVPGSVGRNITTRLNTEVQKELAARGLYTGAIDGVYGAGTTAAVVALQTAGSLVADGIYGAMTDVFAFYRPSFLTTAVQGVRVEGGTIVAGRKITGLNIHHYGSLSDDRAYFASPMNGRKSCPTVTILSSGPDDGKAFEYIHPALQPWSTGTADKDRVSVEIQNATQEPDWQISAKAVQRLITLMVELRMATINKTLIDGCEVDFVLDRQHIQGDQEFRPTTCPGPYVMRNLLDWIAEAQRQVDALTTPTDPDPAPEPVPDPEKVEVDRIWLQEQQKQHDDASAQIGTYLTT